MASKPIQIVAFGASQTAGKIVSRDQAYSSQLERRLRTEGFNVNVVNQGSSGDTTEDERNRLERAIPIGTDIVLFQPGTNDCGRTVPGMRVGDVLPILFHAAGLELVDRTTDSP